MSIYEIQTIQFQLHVYTKREVWTFIDVDCWKIGSVGVEKGESILKRCVNDSYQEPEYNFIG